PEFWNSLLRLRNFEIAAKQVPRKVDEGIKNGNGSNIEIIKFCRDIPTESE
ncbi:hypothetical protein K0M31_003689, partial [Melipona bicolor]